MSSDKLPGDVVDEAFRRGMVSPAQMDWLWAAGWRHFGAQFFRYNVMRLGGRWQSVLALRTVVDEFKLSKSQRRTMRRNEDLQTVIRPVRIDDEKHALFVRHRERFSEYVPDSLYTFLSPYPSKVPCPCFEVSVLAGDRLIACAFLDVGREAVSSVYAMFDPDYGVRRLGIYTMLLEIDLARRLKKRYYYSGYTTVGSSHYDYKKCFNALEAFDFLTEWRPFERAC